MFTQFVRTNKSRILDWTLLAVIFLIVSGCIFIGVRKQSQSFHFEDETDHVAVGWMMNRFHKKLYTDLSTNHQPFPVLAGAVLARVVPYVTMFDLVEHLRLAMFMYGTLWGFCLTVRFKWRGLFSYALTYSVGYYFFAWHVLAESFAAPAVLCIFLFLIEQMLSAHKRSRAQERIDGITMGISFATVVTSLLPLWPFCLLAGLSTLYLSTKTVRKYMVISGLITVGCIFLFFSPIDWFRESVLNNVLYFLPDAPKLSAADWIRVLFFPFLSILKPFDRLAQMLLLPLAVSVSLMISKIYTQKKISKRNVMHISFLYGLLVITNPRVVTFPTAFYQGFHLFPFIAAFFAVVISIIDFSLKKLSPAKLLTFFLICITPLFFFNMSWAMRKTDKLNEYYVQYGTQDSYARLLSAFKADGDTFFSGPNGFGYINMRSDVPIAGRQLFHLQWAYHSPMLREEFHTLLSEHPPTFVYQLEDESGYHADFDPVLKKEYTEVIQDKHRTFLYLLNSKIQTMTETQKKYLEDQNLHFRTAAEVEIF